ncbi:RNA-guided endonuclease IscB [Weissella confusa]|uniref:RNA-guided endonuclease IscB n=1 Tax=Weissella confusa TaxID=1583 RepID=UPI002E1E08E6|nr:RNA-guided endonuclease IscB [Weissella confusa]
MSNKQTFIHVLDANGEPLMPTLRLGMVRRWIKTGQAKWTGNSRQAIRFVRPVEHNTQELVLGVDAGQHLGLSVVSPETKKEYYAGQSESNHRKEVERNNARRMYRRTRRNRLRYRAPRFDNRRREPGWLVPSIQHRLDFTVKEIKRLDTFLPITRRVIEVAPFDNQKLANPNIKPWEYSQGAMQGERSLKRHILKRDGYRDVVDGKVYPESQLVVHHIDMRGKAGTNQPDNLVTVSIFNHTAANHLPGGPLYNLMQTRKARIDYRGAFFMSVLAARLPDHLEFEQTFGYITAEHRLKIGIEKSHINDAFVIAGGDNSYVRSEHQVLRQKKQINNRSLVKFYDAKYFNLASGKVEKGAQLASGRTRRTREVEYDNKRSLRGHKVSNGRVSVRRNHYQIRPGDLIQLEDRRSITTTGVNSGGKRVVWLENGKQQTMAVTKVHMVHHVNGVYETAN